MDLKDRTTIGEYVLLMLGAPVVKIELDPKQLEACVDTAEREVDILLAKVEAQHRYTMVQERSLIEAMNLLARIRGKYKKIPGPNGGLQMDSKELIKTASEMLGQWNWKVQALRKRLSQQG